MSQKSSLPTHVTTYNVYNSGQRLVGINGEFQCPELEMQTSSVTGPGILGEIEFPNPGHVGNTEATVNFRIIDVEAAQLLNDGTVDLTLRADVSRYDSATGRTVHQSFRVTMRGKVKTVTLGTIQASNGADSSIALELLYIKVVVDSRTILELDKLNFIYVVNGKDMLTEVRKNI